MLADIGGFVLGTSGQRLVMLAGAAHAVAAFFYFSKARFGMAWAVAWGLFTLVCLFVIPDNPIFGFGLFVIAVGLWTLWWATLRPSARRDWVMENERQATATIGGDILTVHNVRNFDWRTRQEATVLWETRHFDLAALDRLDLFSCTWGSPHMAHMIVSFGFRDAQPLAFSIETRREASETWSGLAGFFRAYELIIVAADERDVVRLRTNVKGEKVEIYEILATPLVRRRLLEQYIDDMNALAVKPRFYHTIWTNCTTEIARLVRLAGHRVPFDWRILVSGHVAAFLYRQGFIARDVPFAEAKLRADITTRAKAADRNPDFSRRIRGADTTVSA